MCVNLLKRNDIDYRCPIDNQINNHETSKFELNSYLIESMKKSSLYVEFRPLSEQENRPRPRILGLALKEDMRHENEIKILKQVFRIKAVKHVRFRIDEKSEKKSKAKRKQAIKTADSDFPHILYLNKIQEDLIN